MTDFLEFSPLVGISNCLSFKTSRRSNINKCYLEHITKSKQYKGKFKCNKALKRKLKKYKLRQDGQEDQDIIDMSDILVTSLIIRSPNNKEPSNHLSDIELQGPKNYLFKMISREKASSTVNINECCEISNEKKNTICDNSQETKTNAFKLLMDSRHRIIGSNSPGKDKLTGGVSTQDIIEKKSVKTKRLLVLQKMAEEKGALKAKELEEIKDKNIRNKLEKRTEKFKNMLLNPKSKNSNTNKEIDGKLKNNRNVALSVPDNNHCCLINVEKDSKSLKILDNFAQSRTENDEIINQQTTRRESFVKKKTIMKKENMLCYVKLIDKNLECDSSVRNINKSVKSKMFLKSDKNVRLQKKGVKGQGYNNETMKEAVVSENSNICLPKPYLTRKRNFDSDLKPNENNVEVNSNIESSKNRPKRNIKKPVTYVETSNVSSSDEELHIFTSKKIKRSDINTSPNICKFSPSNDNIETLLNSSKPQKKHGKNNETAPIKLAPIFNKSKKPALLVVDIKPKLSDMQFITQRKTNKLKDKDSEVITNFRAVVHVQQIDSNFVQNSRTYDYLPEFDLDIIINNNNLFIDENLFENLVDLTDYKWNFLKKCSSTKSVNDVLHSFKEIKPRFPVYRIYRILRDKKKGKSNEIYDNDLDNSKELVNRLLDFNIEDPDQLSWSDKYKATSTNEIIGNFESINELKKWLVSWQENQCKSKNTWDLDLSDFCHSDTDSDDKFKNVNNLLILKGPVGCGKTSSVYAVAAELAIKVIEVNTSNKRTGKIMLQDLQEATQSHKVNRMNSDNSQKSQEIPFKQDFKKTKKGGKRRKSKKINKLESTLTFKDTNGCSASQETLRTNSSLILIDDADIIFDQDDGFSTAIKQLVQSSKRPVILIVSTLTNPHLQKFLQYGKVLKLHLLSPKILGMWLDIMSLADTGLCCPGVGGKFLDYFKGDIRKTINMLQFYMCTQPQDRSDEVISQTLNEIGCDDENSNMSWVNVEDSNDNQQTEKHITSDSNTNCLWNNFIHWESCSYYGHQLQIFNSWLDLHSLISNTIPENGEINKETAVTEKMLRLAKAVDSISISNYFNSSKNTYCQDVTSPPWRRSEIDNVTEQEDLSSYAKSTQTTGEICKELIHKSLAEVKRTYMFPGKSHIESPGLLCQSETDKIALTHNNLSACLNSSAVLDRRALALDYWSSCRTFCKIEKVKTAVPSRRKTRFCHYLKSLNILCSNESYEQLSDSLCFNKS